MLHYSYAGWILAIDIFNNNTDSYMEIIELSSTKKFRTQFEALLIDSVEDGASIGFITPISSEEVTSYWDRVEHDLQQKTRKIFAAVVNEKVIGCVQLSLCTKKNGLHRGEVEKLMVKTSSRGRGISKELMLLMENAARDLDLSLLVLDTRLGDIASHLYRKLGYIEAGQIPQFARSSNGKLDATIYFFMLL